MKGIRKYFQVKTTPSQVNKRRIEDDDDDIIPESPDVQIKTKKKKTNETQKSSKHKPPKPALKEIKVTDLFGIGPIKRTEPVVEKAAKVVKNTETGIHSDEEFEKSLLEIDVSGDIIVGKNKDKQSIDEPNPTTEEHMSMKDGLQKDDQDKKDDDKPTAKSSSKNNTNDKKTKHSLSTVKPKPEKKSPHKKSSTKEEIKQKHLETKKRVDDIKKEIKETNKRKFEEFIDDDTSNEDINKKKKFNDDFHEGSYKKTTKDKNSSHNTDEKAKVEFHDLTGDDSIIEDEANQSIHSKKRMNKSLNNSALTDEERHERKIHSAALYQKYLNRTGPKQLGSKELPEGADNCLKDCAFLLTGVLDSFERDDIVDTIKKYGGIIKSGISKKVTHVLAGEDAGPAKMAKAEELGIKILNEDDFLNLIRDSKKAKSFDNHDSKTNEKSPHRSKEQSKKHSKKDKSKDRSSKQENNKSEPKKSYSESKSNNNESNVTIKSEVKKEKSDEYSKGKLDNTDHDRKSDEIINGVVKLENSKVESESTSTSSLSSNPIPDNLINSTMWVEKYKPQNLKQIIGQHGDASNVKKLINWLKNWYVSRKAKIPKPSPWAKKDDGAFYKAALLSGPPGVGKTTTVSLVCKELGFDTVEFNASDTRNRTLIKEQIGELLTTTSLSAYAKGDTGKQAITKKHVLVMDEVDGMSGNEDRGGLQELIGLIKSASVPIICMCNDRNSQKMRSLVNYCYDLRFSRPRVEQIKAAMRTICSRENIKIPPEVLGQLIISANQDVRQTINLLSMWAVDPTRMDAGKLSADASIAKKDVKLGPWDAVRKVFSAEDHKKMSLHDKSDLFFYDYSLSPLFVQENYLQVQPHCPKNEILERISKAAESIAIGDVIEKRIRSAQAWNLLPMQAMYSSVIPGHQLSGHVTGQIQFPGWLGKNSRASKMQRLCQEIHAHTRLSATGSKSSIFLDYATHLRDAIIKPLIVHKSDGIEQSLQVLESYHLLRDDLESLTELSMWPGCQNPTVLIDPKVKAAMTRMYNKKAVALPYAPAAVKRGRRDDEDGTDETDQYDDDEPTDSDPENDALIKKNKVKELEKKSSSNNKPSTSKGKSSKGKGKK